MFSDIDAVQSVSMALPFNSAGLGSTQPANYSLSQGGNSVGSLRPDLAVIRTITWSAVAAGNVAATGTFSGNGYPLFIQSNLNNSQGYIGMINPIWVSSSASGASTCSSTSNPQNIIDIRGKDLNAPLSFSLSTSSPTGSGVNAAVNGVLGLSIDFIRVRGRK
jgi:hypothetical protein